MKYRIRKVIQKFFPICKMGVVDDGSKSEWPLIKVIRYFFVFYMLLIQGIASSVPLLVVGGGYYDAGPNHSGGIFQMEYRCGSSLFKIFRPQVVFLVPEMKGFFAGVGVGGDFHISKHFVLFPSFSPGLYYKGGSRDLGYPIEFRACLEAAYEWDNHVRIGCQIYHLSNASLSHRNPGSNALTLILAFPFSIW